ncbi:hypothetical protein [Nocardiopsis potens]|uniref:hypothetical protein n=1 Tax=Nocardiopsis potens TaxID=1246458 RepID=UPI0003470484|nr:hypothetical protein [Nocardiopsis potens]
MTNRRGNGLLADAYVPLILLPPASADLMLEALGRSGIAAYAVRLESDPLDSAPDVADAPTDHLYVDESERDAAERVLRAELPELGDDLSAPGGGAPAAEGAEDGGPAAGGAEDDVWAELVARFYESDPEGRPAWPDAENVSAGEEGPAERRPAAGGDLLAPDYEAADDGPEERERTPRSGEEDGADQGDHYVPPPPPPLPRGDMIGRLAWGGLFGGPAVLLASMLVGARPGWLAFCAVAAFIAGFVVLVVRMGDRASGDNGPDDGAVV